MTPSPTSTTDPLQSNPCATSQDQLTIVVPCYNEEEGIPQLYQKLTSAIERLSEDYEVNVLLVDDGSTDCTLEAIRDTFGPDGPLVGVVSHGENRGIAAAISTGIDAATTEIVCSIDADCTYDPMQLIELVPMLTEDVDVAVVAPYHPGGSVDNIAAWRLVLSHAASRIYAWFFRNRLHTYTSCFRVYRRSVVNQFRPTQPGFVGVVELVWMLDRAGAKFAECPTKLTARAVGHSKMRVISVAFSHFLLMTKIATGIQSHGRFSATAVDHTWRAGQPETSLAHSFHN